MGMISLQSLTQRFFNFSKRRWLLMSLQWNNHIMCRTQNWIRWWNTAVESFKDHWPRVINLLDLMGLKGIIANIGKTWYLYELIMFGACYSIDPYIINIWRSFCFPNHLVCLFYTLKASLLFSWPLVEGTCSMLIIFCPTVCFF